MNVSFRLRNLVKDAQCLNLHRLAQVRVIDDRFDLLQVAPVVMVVMMRRGGQVIVVQAGRHRDGGDRGPQPPAR